MLLGGSDGLTSSGFLDFVEVYSIEEGFIKNFNPMPTAR